MKTLRHGARIALICCISLLTSGCFLNALLSLVVVTSIGELINTVVTLQASANVRVCADLSGTFGSGHERINCTYVIDGERISEAELVSEFGIFGLIVDPVILQVPAAASNFSGTFGGMSVTGNLSITEVSGILRADMNTVIMPEPGTKLVILDFPNPPPPLNNQSFGFTLDFRLPGDATPVQVKALFAARVESNGQTFFPPLLPCETNFANIPTITLPKSAVLQTVNLPLSGVQGCNGRVYTLSGAGPQPIPTTSGWGLLVLSIALGCYAALRLRRHKRSVPSA